MLAGQSILHVVPVDSCESSPSNEFLQPYVSIQYLGTCCFIIAPCTNSVKNERTHTAPLPKPLPLMLHWCGVFFIARAGCFFPAQPAQFGQFFCPAMTTAVERCCAVFTPCELNLLLWYRLCTSLTCDFCVVVTAMALCAIGIGNW